MPLKTTFFISSDDVITALRVESKVLRTHLKELSEELTSVKTALDSVEDEASGYNAEVIALSEELNMLRDQYEEAMEHLAVANDIIIDQSYQLMKLRSGE